MRELSSGSKKKKKKDKKPLKSLVRLLRVAVVALIIVLKLAVLLKFLQTAMQFKFLLISLGGFAIQAVKFWMSIKNNDHDHNHNEEIVYKNPYSSGGDGLEYSSPGGAPYGGGEFNAARSAQDLAYSSQKSLKWNRS